ncbi:cytochrome c oxidase assembly factor 1 family protein [Acidicapsa ligni]|uniref:cytochrome c oxidase assembly factor 1 family protein n=1 Tax=Acidicapsa ligni TaxID=542300 RepID=UPI0021E0EE08|nr:cytochrome c oxidase assembly factor 1 family protein [Acidicapsa ligni]
MAGNSKSQRNAQIIALVFTCPLLALCALLFFRHSSLNRSAAEPAIYAAQSSPVMAAQIGLPMQPGWRIRGSVVAMDGNGNAHLEIPLAGSHGQGKLIEWGQQQNKIWHVCSLTFSSDGGAETILVDRSNTNCAPEQHVF